MEKLCDICGRQYKDELPFCPYCGTLTDNGGTAAAGQISAEKECLHIFTNENDDFNAGFSPLDEPETDFIAFKKAISGQNRTAENSDENSFPDLTKEYLRKNSLHTRKKEISEVFDNHFTDNQLNENGFPAPARAARPQKAAEAIAKTGKTVKKELFDNKAAAGSPASPAVTDMRTLLSELFCVFLGLAASFAVWLVIFDCERKTALSSVPLFSVPLLITAHSLRTKLITAFDNVIVPLFFLLLAGFGLHLGYDNGLITSAWVIAAAAVLQPLCIFVPAQFGSGRDKAENNGKAVVLLTSCAVIGTFVAVSVPDDSFIVILASFLLSAAGLYMSLFEHFGLPILLSTLLPAGAELISFRLLDKDKLPETVRTYVFLALLFVAAVIAVELNGKRNDRPFRATPVNILCIAAAQLLQLLIYFGLSAGTHKYYITLSSEILSVQNAVYTVILLVSDGLYFAVKALVRRSD